MQNPGSEAAAVKLEAFSPLGEYIAETLLVLPVGGKIVRELGEYFGTSLVENSTVRASSDSQVQFLGFLADKSTTTAAAFAVVR